MPGKIYPITKIHFTIWLNHIYKLLHKYSTIDSPNLSPGCSPWDNNRTNRTRSSGGNLLPDHRPQYCSVKRLISGWRVDYIRQHWVRIWKDPLIFYDGFFTNIRYYLHKRMAPIFTLFGQLSNCSRWKNRKTMFHISCTVKSEIKG